MTSEWVSGKTEIWTPSLVLSMVPHCFRKLLEQSSESSKMKTFLLLEDMTFLAIFTAGGSISTCIYSFLFAQ